MATIISRSPGETEALGRRFAARLGPGSVVGMCGDLGAGKTCFIKGLALGLGLDAEISSPTFTLAHEHHSPSSLSLYHLDLYRLESEEEALAAGLDDYLLSEGVTVIEWADKFRPLLPPETLWIRIRGMDENSREIELPE